MATLRRGPPNDRVHRMQDWRGMQNSRFSTNCLAIGSMTTGLRPVILTWVPSYSGIPGNEQSDHLAKTASIGPEPALPNVVKTAMRQWAYAQANNRWQNIKTCRQAKLIIQGHSSGRTRELLRLPRQKLRLATSILTGHSQLNRHLCVLGIISDPTSYLHPSEADSVQNLVRFIQKSHRFS